MIVIKLNSMPTCCLICPYYLFTADNEPTPQVITKNFPYSFRCGGDFRLRRVYSMQEMKSRPKDCPVKIIKSVNERKGVEQEID